MTRTLAIFAVLTFTGIIGPAVVLAQGTAPTAQEAVPTDQGAAPAQPVVLPEPPVLSDGVIAGPGVEVIADPPDAQSAVERVE